jgi:hypothetical protein
MVEIIETSRGIFAVCFDSLAKGLVDEVQIGLSSSRCRRIQLDG